MTTLRILKWKVKRKKPYPLHTHGYDSHAGNNGSIHGPLIILEKKRPHEEDNAQTNAVQEAAGIMSVSAASDFDVHASPRPEIEI